VDITSSGMGGRNFDNRAGARPLVVMQMMALALESMAVCDQNTGDANDNF